MTQEEQVVNQADKVPEQHGPDTRDDSQAQRQQGKLRQPHRMALIDIRHFDIMHKGARIHHVIE
jgi:hypothetical protein